jgi:hypothetical protein
MLEAVPPNARASQTSNSHYTPTNRGMKVDRA